VPAATERSRPFGDDQQTLSQRGKLPVAMAKVEYVFVRRGIKPSGCGARHGIAGKMKDRGACNSQDGREALEDALTRAVLAGLGEEESG
jgi:hypothetical protein